MKRILTRIGAQVAVVQYKLGVAFHDGQGVPLDNAKAVNWYRKAAEQGNAVAQYKLGCAYYFGHSVPQDDMEAYKWLNLATESGFKGAVELRDEIKRHMTPEQSTEGQQRDAECDAKTTAQTFSSAPVTPAKKTWVDLPLVQEQPAPSSAPEQVAASDAQAAPPKEQKEQVVEQSAEDMQQQEWETRLAEERARLKQHYEDRLADMRHQLQEVVRQESDKSAKALDGERTRLKQHYEDRLADMRHQLEKAKQQPKSMSFKCISCGISIRLSLPPNGEAFRCAQCKHGYSITLISATPLSMFIVPDVLREARQPPPPPRQYPSKVRDAFVVLGVEPTDDMEIIKKTFRDMVVQYHPDKVAHLGKDLRHLAEEKTKALVMAYQVIESYLAD